MTWTPETLLSVAAGFWTPCVIQTAVRLDVFSLLAEKPLTCAELAQRANVNERGLELLVTALAALKLLTRQKNGLVSLTAFAQEYLCQQSEGYLGHIIAHYANLLPAWAKLTEAVRQGSPQASAEMESSPREHRNFLLGMHNIASLQVAKCASNIDLSGRKYLLDLGGGPGSYAVEFCRLNSELKATVFDQRHSEPIAAEIIGQSGLEERLNFIGGDFFKDSLPEGYDVLWVSQIIHAYGPLECAELFVKAVQAAAPKALIFVQEFFLDDDYNGPEFPALFGLNMLANTTSGQVYSPSDVSEMLKKAGAGNIELLPLELPNSTRILRAEKL